MAEGMVAEATNGEAKRPDRLTDQLAEWVAARYALAVEQIEDAPKRERWRMLREMCADVVRLRRGDQCAERLAMLQRTKKRQAESRAARGSKRDDKVN